MPYKENCPHTETSIVVLDAFDIHEMIGYQCDECGEIINTETK
jgi:hypothetical protein